MDLNIDLSDVKDFKGLLSRIKGNHDLDSSLHTLKIYCLNSELSKKELFSSIQSVHGPHTKFINDFSVTHLYPESQDEVIFYCYKDPSNPVIFLFSITGKSRIDIAVDNLISRLPKTYYFWMPLFSFEKLKEEIIDMYHNENIYIDYFTGIRTNYYKVDCDFRPHISRKIAYEGNDGMEALRESRVMYGTLPKKIGFSIGSKIQFSINHRNIFIIKRGFPYLNHVWEIINLSLQKYAGVQEVLEKVRFEELKVNNVFDFDIEPLRIQFSRKKTVEDVTTFFELLEIDEHGEGRFCILNPLVMEGSLFFSAMILDANKDALFSISGDEDQMTVLPNTNCEKDTLSRFYEQIDLNFDTNTKLVDND